MNNDFIYMLAGMFVGALVTWLVAGRYYVKASRELATQAEKQRRLSELMLRGLESTGLTEFARDDGGNSKGIVHRSCGNLAGSGASINGSGVTSNDEKP